MLKITALEFVKFVYVHFAGINNKLFKVPAIKNINSIN